MSSPIQTALQAALEGPHVVVEGQISHNVKWTPDDQFFYEFVFENGELAKRDVHFEEGGWGEIAGPVATAIGAYFGKPIPPSAVEEVVNKVENVAHGDWQNAIQKLALRIGLEGYKRMHSVTAYTKSNFQGTSQTFTPGEYGADDFWAVGNDRITSIKVPPRMKVHVCKHKPGVGTPEECKTYMEDTPKLDKEVMGVSYLGVEDRDNPA